MTDVFISWLFVGIPFVGALVCLVFWSDPYRVRMVGIICSVINLAWIAGVSNRLPTPDDGFLPLYLLPLAAVVSTLGQPVHENHRLSWIMTLVFLGLGMGVLTAGNPFGLLCLISLMLIIMFLLVPSSHHTLAYLLVGHRLLRDRCRRRGSLSRGRTAHLSGGILGDLCRAVAAHAFP